VAKSSATEQVIHVNYLEQLVTEPDEGSQDYSPQRCYQRANALLKHHLRTRTGSTGSLVLVNARCGGDVLPPRDFLAR
jgi:hypothetical protein